MEKFKALIEKLDLIEKRLMQVEEKLSCEKYLVSAKKLAEAKGMSFANIKRLALDGKFPSYKPSGKTIFISPIDFDCWVQQYRLEIK